MLKNRFKMCVMGNPVRKEPGISLVTVLATGMVLSIMVGAMLNTIVQVLQKTASLKYAGTARAYAELGMDYAIQQLNTSGNAWNCASSSGASNSMTIPSSVLNDSKANVQVTIAALGSYTTTGNPPTDSMLYDHTTDLNYPYAYRMVTVTSSYGGTTKVIRSLLQPIIPATGGPSTTNTLAVNFPYGVFGLNSVVYAGQAGINSYNNGSIHGGVDDPRRNADGGSLGKVSQVFGESVGNNSGASRGVFEGGSHYEFPNPQSFYGQMYNQVANSYNSSAAASAPWMTMTGNVYSNGVNTAYYNVNSNNVTGIGDIGNGPLGNTSTTPGETIGMDGPTNTGNTPPSAANQFSDGKTASDAQTWDTSPSAQNFAHNVFGLDNGVSAGVPSGGGSATAPGVLADGGIWSGGITNFNSSPNGTGNVTYPQPTMQSVPTAPSGTPNLGNVSLQGSNLVFSDTVPPGFYINPSGATVPLSTIGTVTQGTITLPPGSYIMNSLSLAENTVTTTSGSGRHQTTSTATTPSSMSIDSGTQTSIASGDSPPVQIYLQGANNSSTVLTVDNFSSINMNGISGNSFNTTNGTSNSNIGIPNPSNPSQSMLAPNQLSANQPGASGNITESSGSSSQMQIFYGGNSYNTSSSSYNTQMFLSGNERMTVYAPNTGIMVGSPSVDPNNGPSTLTNDSNFYGAVVGGSVALNSAYTSGGGAFMHYDFKLRPNGQAYLNPWSPSSPMTQPTTTANPPITGYRAVTWQEATSVNLVTKAPTWVQ
jgi:hypothetical protein